MDPTKRRPFDLKNGRVERADRYVRRIAKALVYLGFALIGGGIYLCFGLGPFITVTGCMAVAVGLFAYMGTMKRP